MTRYTTASILILTAPGWAQQQERQGEGERQGEEGGSAVHSLG